jgi:3-phenylpropionate/trans-cinnamate dioxygenase ferredoxin reductase subunit
MPWFWSDQYGHSLQVVGLPSLATRTIKRIRPDGVVVHFGLDDTGSLVSASAFGPGNAVAKDIKAAEVLMRDGIGPTPQQLSDPTLPLLRLRRQALSPATPGDTPTRGQDD